MQTFRRDYFRLGFLSTAVVVVERWHVGDLLPVGVVLGPALLLVVAGASVSVSVLVRVLSRSVAGCVPVAYSCAAVTEVCL